MNIFNLQNILEGFSSPLNEEEAWALCYQGARYLQKKSTKSPSTHYHFNTIASVELNEDGTIARIRLDKVEHGEQNQVGSKSMSAVKFRKQHRQANETQSSNSSNSKLAQHGPHTRKDSAAISKRYESRIPPTTTNESADVKINDKTVAERHALASDIPADEMIVSKTENKVDTPDGLGIGTLEDMPHGLIEALPAVKTYNDAYFAVEATEYIPTDDGVEASRIRTFSAKDVLRNGSADIEIGATRGAPIDASIYTPRPYKRIDTEARIDIKREVRTRVKRDTATNDVADAKPVVRNQVTSTEIEIDSATDNKEEASLDKTPDKETKYQIDTMPKFMQFQKDCVNAVGSNVQQNPPHIDLLQSEIYTQCHFAGANKDKHDEQATSEDFKKNDLNRVTDTAKPEHTGVLAQPTDQKFSKHINKTYIVKQMTSLYELQLDETSAKQELKYSASNIDKKKGSLDENCLDLLEQSKKADTASLMRDGVIMPSIRNKTAFFNRQTSDYEHVTAPSPITSRPKHKKKRTFTKEHYMLVKCLGVVVFKATDYGFKYSLQQVMSNEFENLITRMTNCDNEEEEDQYILPTITLHDVIKLCCKHAVYCRHVAERADARTYYIDVLKKLLDKYLELTGYIKQIERLSLLTEQDYPLNHKMWQTRL